jgi:hypothetical protein
MKYGHRITDEPFYDGIPQPVRIYNEESIPIIANEDLVNEILTGLDSIVNNTSEELVITIKRNKEGKLRLIRKVRVQ